jgi:hypothetical protein
MLGLLIPSHGFTSKYCGFLHKKCLHLNEILSKIEERKMDICYLCVYRTSTIQVYLQVLSYMHL